MKVKCENCKRTFDRCSFCDETFNRFPNDEIASNGEQTTESSENAGKEEGIQATLTSDSPPEPDEPIIGEIDSSHTISIVCFIIMLGLCLYSAFGYRKAVEKHKKAMALRKVYLRHNPEAKKFPIVN